MHEAVAYGFVLEIALALLAAGSQDIALGRLLTSVEDADAVADNTGADPLSDGVRSVDAAARLAFVVELTGGDATAVGGVDLLARMVSMAQDDGRFVEGGSDRFTSLEGHAFALLALDTAGQVPAEALVQGLLAAQCPDGSFPYVYEPDEGTSCTGRVEVTGLVLQALAALDLGSDDAARSAVDWLRAQQQDDGSFLQLDNGMFPGPRPPVDITGPAVLGLNAVGEPTGDAVVWLTAQQNDDGGLHSADRVSNAGSTALALPALAGTTYQHSARFVARQAVPVPPSSPTPNPTATPTPSRPPSPPTTVSTAPEILPITGIDSADVLLSGVALVAAGSVLLAASRPRRRGRHAA